MTSRRGQRRAQMALADAIIVGRDRRYALTMFPLARGALLA